jgi:HPt (histidine-containing phosphotransfer) domain-containing protein
MPEDDVIDHAVLTQLLEDTGGDPEFIAELVETFAQDGPEMLDEIRTAIASGDAGRLRRAAHSLKSNSASLGATRLAELSATIEHGARDGRLAGEDDYAALAGQFEAARSALQALYPAED